MNLRSPKVSVRGDDEPSRLHFGERVMRNLTSPVQKVITVTKCDAICLASVTMVCHVQNLIQYVLRRPIRPPPGRHAPCIA